VDLRSPVFTHGQFYIAASQVTLKAGLVVLFSSNISQTFNIVYLEILQNIN
jgi:hypothetical protein